LCVSADRDTKVRILKKRLLAIIKYLSYFLLSKRSDGIDPFKYMLHLCKHIAQAQTVEDIEALLPWNLKEQLKR